MVRRECLVLEAPVSQSLLPIPQWGAPHFLFLYDLLAVTLGGVFHHSGLVPWLQSLLPFLPHAHLPGPLVSNQKPSLHPGLPKYPLCPL